MGTANILVPQTHAIRVLQIYRHDVVITNVGHNVVYLDITSSVSPDASDYQMRPGERVTWSAGTECWAVSETVGPSLISIAHATNDYSSPSLGAGANAATLMFNGPYQEAKQWPDTGDTRIWDARRYQTVRIATQGPDFLSEVYTEVYWINDPISQYQIAYDRYFNQLSEDFNLTITVKGPYFYLNFIFPG